MCHSVFLLNKRQGSFKPTRLNLEKEVLLTRHSLDSSLLPRRGHSSRGISVAGVSVDLPGRVEIEHVDTRVVEVSVGEGRSEVHGTARAMVQLVGEWI